MIATASSISLGTIRSAIDGTAAADNWWLAVPCPQWLQLDLGARYTVGYLKYQPRIEHMDGRVKDYNICVSDDPNSWGEPVATGTFSNTDAVQETLLASKTGRYLRLECLSGYGNSNYAGASELWLYGQHAATISEFAVADQATGSTKFINTPTAAVPLFAIDPPDANGAERALEGNIGNG